MSPVGWSVVFLFLFLIGINFVAVLTMQFDKYQSQNRFSRRVPEMTFFSLAILGGWIGIWWGIGKFHHKTQKRSFQAKIIGGAIVNVGFLLVIGLTIIKTL